MIKALAFPKIYLSNCWFSCGILKKNGLKLLLIVDSKLADKFYHSTQFFLQGYIIEGKAEISFNLLCLNCFEIVHL